MSPLGIIQVALVGVGLKIEPQRYYNIQLVPHVPSENASLAVAPNPYDISRLDISM